VVSLISKQINNFGQLMVDIGDCILKVPSLSKAKRTRGTLWTFVLVVKVKFMQTEKNAAKHKYLHGDSSDKRQVVNLTFFQLQKQFQFRFKITFTT
jgi:hypothetical protein